jgi:Zn-finger nucleic acid-binding protein
MNCPVCNVQLMMADRQGVEVNYCPTCRGVWIDRGGLDKIIDRSGAYATEGRSNDAEREHQEHDHQHGYERRHKRSFFSDLFD